jgi:outer membrane protein TolC
VRESWSAQRTAYETARHYRDEIVPLRKRISEEQLLRYNGMLISVFELLADAREQVVAVNAAIESQRDFWVADADLQAALNGASGGRAAPARAAAPASPARAGH